MPGEFSDLIARLRGGDARAAEELFRKNEPVIRMEARRQMRDPRLRRAFDSMDVCQSVLGSFFLRAWAPLAGAWQTPPALAPPLHMELIDPVGPAVLPG